MERRFEIRKQEILKEADIQPQVAIPAGRRIVSNAKANAENLLSSIKAT